VPACRGEPGGAGSRTDTPGTAGPPEQAGSAQVPSDGSLDACGRERRLVTRTRERHAGIRARLDADESLSAISRHLPGPRHRAAVRPRRERR
jgi:hypothetical protein